MLCDKVTEGLPWWLGSEEFICNTGDTGSIPVLGRSPGDGNGNLLQYTCPGNPMDREAWQATIHWVTKVGLCDWTATSYRKVNDYVGSVIKCEMIMPKRYFRKVKQNSSVEREKNHFTLENKVEFN